MSKAIEGAAMIGGAAILGGLMLFPGTAAFFNNPIFYKALEGLALGGISMEAGSIASALTSNRGMNITTRQSAAARQIIYGTQRVGGVMIYKSTTGSKHDQMNYVIVIAGHPCDAIVNLYLDGRQVFWQEGSVGNYTQGGVNFGGHCDGNDHVGPNGVKYNFGAGNVYCQAYMGHQTNQPNTVAGGGYDTGLHANDPVWGPSAEGLPYVGGCTYVYLKIEYNTTTFPAEPEIRFTVNGKNDIFDPRTGTTGFTTNWALIVGDVITNTEFGLGDPTVNQDQLIAAANICDEQIALAAGGTEAQYACSYHYDTGTGPGDVLATMMDGAAGRLSRIGGEWYIWPAAWLGPAFSFDSNALTGTIEWNAYRSESDLVNRVTGTYLAPNFPYNIAGNLYDANGYWQGEIQNNFGYAFQPTNFPQYAEDTLHGYASDQWLNADGGVFHPKELTLSTVLSVTQAQRIAKITLERNRQQGMGTFPMNLNAWQMQPQDVMQFTFAEMGWAKKFLEISQVNFQISDGHDGTKSVLCAMSVQETAASVYEWTTTEEQTIYAAPAISQTLYVPAAPTNMTLTSGASTAVTGADGVVQPRVMVTWNTPEDILVTQVQVQYQPTLAGDTTWIDAGLVDVANNVAYVAGVVAGAPYNFRLRSLRPKGAASPWIEEDDYTVTLTLSSVTSTGQSPNVPYNTSNNATVDSIAENGAATIRVYGPGGDGSSFTRYVGAVPSTMSAAHITGLAFSTSYYVIFDTGSRTYQALTNYNSTLADAYIFVGNAVTCVATYTGGTGGTGSGGSAGGGGANPGGGRNPIMEQNPN
jgi:hypothetical protein